MEQILSFKSRPLSERAGCKKAQWSPLYKMAWKNFQVYQVPFKTIMKAHIITEFIE